MLRFGSGRAAPSIPLPILSCVVLSCLVCRALTDIEPCRPTLQQHSSTRRRVVHGHATSCSSSSPTAPAAASSTVLGCHCAVDARCCLASTSVCTTARRGVVVLRWLLLRLLRSVAAGPAQLDRELLTRDRRKDHAAASVAVLLRNLPAARTEQRASESLSQSGC